MVLGIGKGKKERKERERNLAEDMVRAEAMRGEPMSREMMNEMGTIHHILTDEVVIGMLWNDPQFRFLIPVVSHLGRTTKITRKDAEIQMLEVECLMDEHKMNMDEDTFDVKGWAKIKAYELYVKDAITDKIEGHRGRLATEKIKILETRVNPEKKKGLLG